MSSILVQVIVGGLLLGAVYALFSSGLTLVWGMMNIVNFAHGDFVMLGMYVAFVVWTLFGAGPWAGAPLAALALATLGVIVYFGLIRDIMKGPMLAQILGPFGLALLLRYSVFWWFGANFLSLPENIVGGTFDIAGLRIQASRLLAGGVALAVTLSLHLLLTRTSLGSKMLAVAEDSTAAQLMGIRPDTMQAIAWAIAAGATGLAGALIATFFYIVPTVGETLGIVAFVTVSLGGFGSVPGALVAGLLIGVIESLSAYLIGAVYKDIVVYSLFLGFLWFRPQAMMRRLLWPSVALALVIAYPHVFSTPFEQRLGALVLLYAIAASAWNIVGGYAGQVSVGHVVFFGCGAYAAMGAYSHFALSPLVGMPAGIVLSVAIAAVVGVPTLRLSGHYFSMATIAVAELIRLIVTNTEYLGAGVGLSGPTVPRNVFDLSFISALPYYYVFLAVLVVTLGITWWMADNRMGFYLRAIRDSERAARSLGAPASRTKLYAFMLSAGLTSVAGALYAMMFGFVDPESGLGILISVKILIMAALGGAGLLFGPLVGAAILVPLEEISNNKFGGQGAGLTFVVYGAIIMLIARFQPGGLLTLANRIMERRAKARETATTKTGAGHAP